MVKPGFHRCSLMVKVLCVWYYSWSGGSIFEPRFCKKHDFHKFSVFVKRHILQSKKVFLWWEGYTLSNTCMVKKSLGSIDRFPDGKNFMCMVLFLVRREHLWTQVLQKTWFSQILSFRKEAHFAVKKKSSSREGYTLSNTCMVKPRFHRCSLMVKVLCVWYYSWSGGSIFEPRFCKKHDFHKFSVFIKRHILRSKKVFLPRGLYLIQHLYGEA